MALRMGRTSSRWKMPTARTPSPRARRRTPSPSRASPRPSRGSAPPRPSRGPAPRAASGASRTSNPP
eukprot:3686699-Alexandrium_andersonii.AAC.1